MQKQSKRTLVPRLRFPEFRSSGKWKSDLIAEVATISKGKGISKADVAEDGITPCIRYAELYTLYGEVINDVRSHTNISPGELVLSQAEDVILPASGETRADIATAACVMREGVALGGDLNILRSALHGPFFSYLLNSPLRYKIAQVAQGDTVAHLYPSQISKISIASPHPAEQRRIADCLTSLDELITAEADQLDALKAHKKGLMQQLFPREGETTPRLRFPEFEGTGEWEEKRIGDLKPFVTSGSRGWAAFYADQGSLFVRITNLTQESISLDLTDKKFVQLPPSANEGVRTQLKEYDVLISITADIGIVGYVDASIPSPAFINQHIALVRFDASQVSSKFVCYFLASERSQILFRASTDLGTKAGMSLIEVQNIQVVLPALPEQHRITDCLTSLDDLLTAQAAKIETLKAHKKGLMQQLFPTQEVN